MKTKKIIGFFAIYVLLMASLILGVISSGKSKNEVKNSSPSVSEIFKEELKKSTPKKQLEAAVEEKWRPSNEFVRNAVIGASVLDVVIILIWARHMNRKKEGRNDTKIRLTDRKWFWNIVALGIVQPKDSKLVLNWRNLILAVAAMYILKKYALDALLKEDSAGDASSLISSTALM